MVTALTGKNYYALKAALDKLVQEAQAATGEFGIERIDGSEVDVDTILQAVQSLPFLVPSKLIVVYNAQSNQALMDRVEEVIERTPDVVSVVLVGPVFDKRKTSWSLLKKRAHEVREFNELKPFELPKWVVAEAKNMGLAISNNDAAYFVDRVGSNQMMLQGELRKMSLNTSQITKEIIDQQTDENPQTSVFQMLDAAFTGKQQRAVELYRAQRKKRVEPHYIIAMLTWQLQALALAVFADPATEQSLTQAGQSPYAARKALSLAKTISRSDVKRYINKLVDLESNIKVNAEPDAALELYLLELAQA